MFTKKNYILFIVLLALMVGAWAYTVPYQNWLNKKQRSDSGNFLSQIKMENIDRIEVTDENNNIHVLKKSNSVWTYGDNNWPTEQILIDALEGKMVNIINSDFTVASVNESNKPNFGITESSPRVKLFQKDLEVVSFIIGNPASDYQSSYIARENDEKTYAIPETLVRAFDFESWADRTITNTNSASIDTVVFTYPTYAIEITNKPATSGEVYWRTVELYEKRLKKEKVEEFLNKVAKLEAIDIPEQTEENTGLDAPQLILEIKGAGVNERLSIGNKTNEDEYYLKQEKTGRIFLISKATRDDLFKQVRDFQ